MVSAPQSDGLWEALYAQALIPYGEYMGPLTLEGAQRFIDEYTEWEEPE